MNANDLPTDENKLNEIYKFSSKKIIFFVLLIITTFTIGFLANFQSKKILNYVIKNKILKKRSCPLTYKSINFGYFPPRIEFKNIFIPSSCYGERGKVLTLNRATLKFKRPSLSPLGIVTEIKAISKKFDQKIIIFPTLGFNQVLIKIPHIKMNSNFINYLASKEQIVSGRFELEALFVIKNQLEGHILIKSKNLKVLSQNINGLEIPNLSLKDFLLKANIKNKTLHLSDLIIGNRNAPLRSQFKGKVFFNDKNIKFSKFDLDGKIKLSVKLKEQFPILNILLAGKTMINGHYKVNLYNTFSSPQIRFK